MDPPKRQKRDEDADAALGDALEKLQEVQEELDKIQERASDEILKVEEKYIRERRPVYQRRSEIIAGIPDFWTTAMMSHPVLFSSLTEEDHAVFEHLQALDVEDYPDVRSGYTISMTFKDNPFFEDKVLKKSYTFSEEGGVKVAGTKIRWRPGKDVTAPKQQNGDDKDGKKRALEEMEGPSFFKWFEAPEEDDESGEGAGEDDISEAIREEIWPNALKFFTSDGIEDEDDGEGEDGEGEEGEEGDEEGGGEEGEEDLEGEEE